MYVRRVKNSDIGNFQLIDKNNLWGNARLTAISWCMLKIAGAITVPSQSKICIQKERVVSLTLLCWTVLSINYWFTIYLITLLPWNLIIFIFLLLILFIPYLYYFTCRVVYHEFYSLIYSCQYFLVVIDGVNLELILWTIILN